MRESGREGFHQTLGKSEPITSTSGPLNELLHAALASKDSKKNTGFLTEISGTLCCSFFFARELTRKVYF